MRSVLIRTVNIISMRILTINFVQISYLRARMYGSVEHHMRGLFQTDPAVTEFLPCKKDRSTLFSRNATEKKDKDRDKQSSPGAMCINTWWMYRASGANFSAQRGSVA